MPGLDNTRLFMSFTAGAGTRCMSLLSSSPSLWVFLVTRVTGLKTPRTHSLEMKEREDVCLETDPCIWNPWTLLDINSRPRGNPAVNVQERRVQRDSQAWSENL